MPITLRTISVDQINQAPYNPRSVLKPGSKDYDSLKRSIEKFGMVEPIIWNRRTGNIVGGHQRYNVGVARGEKEFEVSEVDLSDGDEKILNLALNKIQGEWDLPKLKDILNEIRADPDDFELTGFDEMELDMIEDQTVGFVRDNLSQDKRFQVPAVKEKVLVTFRCSTGEFQRLIDLVGLKKNSSYVYEGKDLLRGIERLSSGREEDYYEEDV